MDYSQRQPVVEAEAEARDWLLLIPNFRGPFNSEQSCGSQLVQQDVLDAIAWAREEYAVDDTRIYAMGLSGGGYMTMLMASRYPEVWAAASSFVGISDLSAWYTNEHSTDRYSDDMKACFGGAPGDSPEIAASYLERSPIRYLRSDLGVPIAINAGLSDGIVSIEHSLRAFQALAPGTLEDAEAEALLAAAGPDAAAPAGFTVRVDPLFGRRIFLRREADNVRLTIFEGGHEWFPEAAFAWVEQFQRP